MSNMFENISNYSANISATTMATTTINISMAANTTMSYAYCSKALDDFHTKYSAIHGYVAIIVCIFGCIANILNIIVLTRHEMRSPTNAILTGLALADFLVMIDYIPYAYHSIHPGSLEERFTYMGAVYVMFHSLFGQLLHTISIWLTVTLAVWRYIAVAHPQRNRLWNNMQTTTKAIISSCIFCPLLVIPLYFSFQINGKVVQVDELGNQVTNGTGRNVTLYSLQAVQGRDSLLKFNFWVYSILIKLLPCIALTILSWRLIGALVEAKKRRKQLCNANNLKPIVNGKAVTERKNSRATEKERQTDRTTKMLLAVLLLFLLTEFPQGILGLLSALLNQSFFENCYLKLGDVMDAMALVNSAINFILYCSMSRQFRTTFSILFRPKFLDKWLPVPQGEDGFDRTHGGKNDNGHTTQVTQV